MEQLAKYRAELNTIDEEIIALLDAEGREIDKVLYGPSMTVSEGYFTGCADVESLRTKTKFVRITGAGIRESHVHDVMVTKEAPNYQRE